MGEDIVYIYALIDPISKEVKYVGQTKDVEQRLDRHLREKTNTQKYNWILSLKEKGMVPDFLVLEKINSEAPHFIYSIRERFWAIHFIDAGNVIFNKPRLVHRKPDVIYEMLFANNETNNSKWIIK